MSRIFIEIKIVWAIWVTKSIKKNIYEHSVKFNATSNM